MNIRHLEHFLAVAETGSFSRAAERLHLTQSALSRSIQSLEDEVSGRLLDRVGKRNELTPLGRQVVERARRIVLEASELRRGAELMRQANAGAVRVGLGSGPGALLMTPLMCHMAQHHPQVRVRVVRAPTELQLVKLRTRELDALIVDMRAVPPEPDLNIEPVAEMQGGWIVRAGHPLLAQRTVTLDDVLRYPIASTPLSHEVARQLAAQYGGRALPARIVTLECDDVESMIDVVERTDTVLLGVLATARERMAAGALAVLPVRPALRATARFAYVTLAGRSEAPVMAILREFVAQRMVD
ncbi:MAG: LysR family transcriptional regulator [Hydrogenophaga sp.]|uniref:LysR family transcriptional regulator n=1 Tax=Hydrogenophaga crocea TaxID=2716225 RepID=A0A6G8IN43_9BURK|nr:MULTISPECIES: LysR family transcriptional regulator [Hydrogenophaga]MBL0943695.1 LysR family transcriptional regulator [Hydrogenophaga sp.]QIM54581.1 LysR family transcriptional regulator [Hydrogenophaga crocea]